MEWGEGPGEFRGIDDLSLLPGDTLLVWDALSSRATLHGPEGELAGTVPLERPPGTQYPTEGILLSIATARRVVRAPSGGFVSIVPGPRVMAADVGQVTPWSTTVRVVEHDPEGTLGESIVEVPGEGQLLVPRSFEGSSTRLTYQAPRTWYALEGDRIHFVHSGRFEVLSHDAEGRLVQRARYPRLERPMTPEDWRRARREAEEREQPPGVTIDPRWYDVGWDERWRPEIHWPYAGIRTDAEGNLWLRAGLVSRRWLVLGPDGVAKAVADTGPGHVVMDLGRDHILVKRRNELDVPIVKVLRIVREER